MARDELRFVSARRSCVVLAVAAGLVALFMLPAVAHAGTLDQQQAGLSHGVTVSGSDYFAQTFTAGLSGQLDQVDLILQEAGEPAGLTIEIRNVEGDVPGATVLDSVDLKGDDVSGEKLEWVSVPMNAPSVTGTQYAIVLSSPGNSLACVPGCYVLGLQESNPYAGGSLLKSSDSGVSWNPVLVDAVTTDAAFKTYVATTCLTPDGDTTGYSKAVIDDGPAGYWRLGESSGPTAFDSANEFHGTYTGTFDFNVPGAIAGDPNTAVDFSPDAKNRVPTTLAHAPSGSIRSFEGWACRPQNQGFDVFFSGDKRFNSPGMWTDHGDLDRIWFDPRREGGTGPRFWDGVMPPDDEWFHWVLIFNDPANTAELYINGVSKGIRSVTEPYHAFPGNFQIGNYGQINEAWNGPLDEVAVYERALDPQEISDHQSLGIGKSP